MAEGVGNALKGVGNLGKAAGQTVSSIVKSPKIGETVAGFAEVESAQRTTMPSVNTLGDFESGEKPANNLRQFIRKNGIDESFEALADGRVDESEEPTENSQSEPEKQSQTDTTEEQNKEQKESASQGKEREEEADEKIEELERKIAFLEEKNRELASKLEAMEKKLAETAENAEESVGSLEQAFNTERDANQLTQQGLIVDIEKLRKKQLRVA